MDTLEILDNLRVASPCSASWEGMVGDDRVRSCASCEKNVYNLSELTRSDAEDLVRNSEGRLCVRFFRRADGTILTADCPVGVRQAVRRRLLRIAATGLVVFATIRSGLWLAVAAGTRPSLGSSQTGQGFRPSVWADRALRRLGLGGLAGGGSVVMGDICVVPGPMAGAPGSLPPGGAAAGVPPATAP